MKLGALFSELNPLIFSADKDLEIIQVTSDSRKVRKGGAFVALKGTKYDGHIWIDAALENGASVIVCQEKPRQEIPYILIEDTRSALPLLLSKLYGHPEKSFRHMIAITGTNGKTTTSFMIKAIFEAAGHKTGLIGTTKYLIGDVPYEKVDPAAAFLTTPDPEILFDLLNDMRAAGVDTVIMEASSHALYFKKLTGLHFNFGVFTNLTQDHLDFHKTIEEYLAAKKRLFEICDVGVFNRDDPHFSAISEGVSAAVRRFSVKGNDAEYCVKEMLREDEKGISYRCAIPGGEMRIDVEIPGSFTVYNSLGAAAVALEAGITQEDVARGLKSLSGVKGRIERIPTDTPYSVFIDFAHTPDALENILVTLREFTRGKLWCLFGCGGDRDRGKRPIMGRIAGKLSDVVVVTSDNSRTEEKEDIIRDILPGLEGCEKPVKTIVDRTEAIKWCLDNAGAGDVILLAGKGHEEYEIDKTGKHPFSEREIVKSYMGERKQ
ncbi:MAG: UDP-N-acetylmuramoyl-L-alanyl-D-glutamate--2,6-diaminopimelate ligase [Clostridia bacterium]|nr:UDP-N-acetylmuramoyl-L-alanyl-D-glutamate--2,6-diaminopimelate ligase [Clostridia bacterium]